MKFSIKQILFMMRRELNSRIDHRISEHRKSKITNAILEFDIAIFDAAIKAIETVYPDLLHEIEVEPRKLS